jgi:uncharacterized protein (DUF2147 family)
MVNSLSAAVSVPKVREQHESQTGASVVISMEKVNEKRQTALSMCIWLHAGYMSTKGRIMTLRRFRMWTSGCMTVILFSAILSLQAAAVAADGNGKTMTADYERLAGKWLRPDGGYILELKEVGKDGSLKASYFNPRPINVAKAEWRRMGDRLQVFVELRDLNYPGSTYTLIYSPEKDLLEGYYFQAVQGQTYTIQFMRAK